VARQTIQVLTDDLDGGKADETVVFALDGIQYEIDLSKDNASKLRDAFAPFVGASRKLGRGAGQGAGRSGAAAGSGGGRGRGGGTGDRDQNRAIREWAQAKGINVSDRGRIKQDIVDQYRAEMGR
jgi:hypothetical protein